MTNLPIGKLKTKADVYCEICGCKYVRRVSILVYSKEEVEGKKIELRERVTANYCCRICKSIAV